MRRVTATVNTDRVRLRLKPVETACCNFLQFAFLFLFEIKKKKNNDIFIVAPTLKLNTVSLAGVATTVK